MLELCNFFIEWWFQWQANTHLFQPYSLIRHRSQCTECNYFTCSYVKMSGASSCCAPAITTSLKTKLILKLRANQPIQVKWFGEWIFSKFIHQILWIRSQIFTGWISWFTRQIFSEQLLKKLGWVKQHEEAKTQSDIINQATMCTCRHVHNTVNQY
jgi:hypothetical protein